MKDRITNINQKLNIALRVIFFIAGTIVFIVSILGYVFSYSDVRVFLQYEVMTMALASLSKAMILVTIVFIFMCIMGVLTFIMYGNKISLKHIIKIILVTPVALIILFGYSLTSMYFNIAYDVSFSLLLALFTLAIFLGGIKFGFSIMLVEDENII